jgi:hypothetical protein
LPVFSTPANRASLQLDLLGTEMLQHKRSFVKRPPVGHHQNRPERQPLVKPSLALMKFPLRKDMDFVKLHSEGFNNKENLDLFQHFLKMFQKNHLLIKKILQEKQIRAMQMCNDKTEPKI